MTAAVGFGQKAGMTVRDQGDITQRLLVALALLVLRQLHTQLYRQFMGGKLNASEVMLGLHDRLSLDDIHLSIAVRAVTAYLDVLGEALGTPAVTKDQFQEIASLYGLQGGLGDYQSYCKFRESVQGHLRAGMSRQVLAAVEMSHDWPNRYLRA